MESNKITLLFLLLLLCHLSVFGIDSELREAEKNKTYVYVSQEGRRGFRTISEAIASIPKNNRRRVIVSISPGVYREKIKILNKDFVTLRGEDHTNPPKITWNDTADSANRSTLLSATVSVDSDYFRAINMMFEKPIKHLPGVNGSQAVALEISGTKGSFYNCSFFGYQDTLYDRQGLHYFKNCNISGDVDFIFGQGQSLYEGCVITCIGDNGGFITAQKRTEKSLSSGFSFMKCQIRGLDNNNKVYLGRAWGNYSRVVFSSTHIEDTIIPLGWDDWGNINHDLIYYGEYNCSVPGASRIGRVPWSRNLTYEEARPFLGTSFVNGAGWIIDPR